MLVLMHGRGIWLDEASSYRLTSHDLAIGSIVRDRWITDVHPPLFSAYGWALQPLLGGSVRSMRLINLGGLLMVALTARAALRRGIDRDFLALFAVLVAGSPFFILYAAEFRSYFLQMLLSACLIVQLRMVHEGRAPLVLLGATALLLVNLHYLGSLIGLILIGAQAVACALTGRGRLAVAMLGIMMLSVVPLAIALVAMLSAITPVSVNDVSAARGLIAIGAVLGSAVLPYVSALAFLPRSAPPTDKDRSFAIVLIGSSVAIAGTYALLNLVTHNLLPRHMIAAAAIGAALLALLLEDRVKSARWALPLVCANALLLALAATVYGLTHKRWEANVAAIQTALTSCPASRVYALNTMSLLPADDKLHSVPAIDEYFGLTYRLIARDAGYGVRVVPDGRDIVPKAGCPSLLWVEHHYARPDIGDVELARIAGFEGAIRVVRLQRGDARALLAVSAR